MRLEKYIVSEGLRSEAFFISPKGELVGVGMGTHIDIITSNPEKFGYTKEHVRKTYEKYGERIGVEGKAREELILDVVERGWIHVRKRAKMGWMVNVMRMTKKSRDLIHQWAERLITKGYKGVKELNKFSPVIIMTFEGNYKKDLTMDILAKDGLHEANEEIKYKLIIEDE
jgi:hypothetical protein